MTRNVARTMVDHVLASAENVTATIGEDLGPYAERAVRKRLETLVCTSRQFWSISP
jgi:hypothetical protein